MKKCPFCAEMYSAKSPYTDLAEKVLGLPQNRILYEGRHWIIVPTVGAIVPGYLLFVSKSHRLSVAACGQDEVAELQKLTVRTRQILEEQYRAPCVLFEHGEGCSCQSTATSVSHCHLHIAPCQGDLIDVDEVLPFACPISGLSDIRKHIGTHNSYLFYQSNAGRNYIFTLDWYPSQYFRKKMAYRVGLGDQWNWRTNPRFNSLKETYERLRALDFAGQVVN